MSPTSDDLYAFSGNAVNQSIGIIDPSAPKAAQVSPQRFGLADPVVSVPQNVLQKQIDPF